MAPARVKKETCVRACVTRPIHVCPQLETRMQRGAIASRATAAFHAIIVTQDRERLEGAPRRGGGRERDLIAGSRFHGERVLFTETQQAGLAALIFPPESSQKSKVVAQFSSSSSSSLRDINGKLMVESCIYIPLQRFRSWMKRYR